MLKRCLQARAATFVNASNALLNSLNCKCLFVIFEKHCYLLLFLASSLNESGDNDNDDVLFEVSFTGKSSSSSSLKKSNSSNNISTVPNNRTF